MTDVRALFEIRAMRKCKCVSPAIRTVCAGLNNALQSGVDAYEAGAITAKSYGMLVVQYIEECTGLASPTGKSYHPKLIDVCGVLVPV